MVALRDGVPKWTATLRATFFASVGETAPTVNYCRHETAWKCTEKSRTCRFVSCAYCIFRLLTAQTNLRRSLHSFCTSPTVRLNGRALLTKNKHDFWREVELKKYTVVSVVKRGTQRCTFLSCPENSIFPRFVFGTFRRSFGTARSQPLGGIVLGGGELS